MGLLLRSVKNTQFFSGPSQTNTCEVESEALPWKRRRSTSWPSILAPALWKGILSPINLNSCTLLLEVLRCAHMGWCPGPPCPSIIWINKMTFTLCGTFLFFHSSNVRANGKKFPMLLSHHITYSYATQTPRHFSRLSLTLMRALAKPHTNTSNHIRCKGTFIDAYAPTYLAMCSLLWLKYAFGRYEPTT